MHKNQHQTGFSLIELAIVLLIVGILTGGGIGLYSKFDQHSKIIATTEQLEAIQQAIENYTARHGILPCPSSLTAKTGDKELGTPTDCANESIKIGFCNKGYTYCVKGGRIVTDLETQRDLPMRVRIGALPTRALNVPMKMARDQWGNHIIYAVTELLTRSPAHYSEYDGAIEIIDEGGHSVITPEGIATYALVSSGPDRSGAFAYGGGGIGVKCNAGETADGINCDLRNKKAVFRTADYSGADGKAYYDDFVAFRTRNTFKASGAPQCRDYPICDASNAETAPICQVRGGSDGMPLCTQRQDLRGGPEQGSPYEHDFVTWKRACNFGDGWHKPDLAELRTLFVNQADIGGFEKGDMYLTGLSYNPVLIGNEDQKAEVWAVKFSVFAQREPQEKRISISPSARGSDKTGRIRCVKR